MLLVDLATRSTDLVAHYSDAGVLPRQVLISELAGPWHWSVHMLGGSWQAQAALFALQALFAVALTLGYHTRLATALSWFMLVSLHNRNPLIFYGADVELSVLLFWCMFLPLGARMSVDSARTLRPHEQPPVCVSAASAAYLLQICFIYWFTAGLKDSAVWWQEGSAVYYTLNIDLLAKPLGTWMLQFPWLTAAASRGTLLLEVVGPLLALSPWARAGCRTTAALIFIAFHLLALNPSLELGIFCYVAALAWLPFFPSRVWSWGPLQRLEAQAAELAAWCSRRLPGQASPTAARAPRAGLQRLRSVLVALLLLYVLLWNLRGLDRERFGSVLPKSLDGLGITLGIDQYWDLFTPYPMKDDGWYVIPGRLLNGQYVDLFTDGGVVTWDKPERVSQTMPNQRWIKYMMNLWKKKYAGQRLHYGRALCRRWNGRHRASELLELFRIVYVLEVTPPPGLSPKTRKITIWDHNCTKPSD